MRGQRDLRLARQTQSGRPTPFDHQFHRRRGLRHFYLHETRRRLAPVPALPPATKGGVMDTLLAGKIGSGQPAAIKRPQKLSAPGGIGPRRAASLRNTTLLHDRVFITARWQLIGGPCFTAYSSSKSRVISNFSRREKLPRDAITSLAIRTRYGGITAPHWPRKPSSILAGKPNWQHSCRLCAGSFLTATRCLSQGEDATERPPIGFGVPRANQPLPALSPPYSCSKHATIDPLAQCRLFG